MLLLVNDESCLRLQRWCMWPLEVLMCAFEGVLDLSVQAVRSWRIA
jgi:hypothetical protein